MFDNIGSKIKTVASVIAWIGIISSVLTGFILMAQDDDAALIGLLVMVIGSLSSWVSSFITYGFGQLVENSDKLVSMQNETCIKTIKNSNEMAEKINTLNKWKADGLITEEEYAKKLAELKGE